MEEQEKLTKSKKLGAFKKLLIGFLIKVIVVFVVWQIAYYWYLQPDGRLNDFLSDLVVQGTDFGLRLLGYNTFYEGHYIYLNNQAIVLVTDGCNGLELFALYVGFLICFPGRWKYKSIFIPAGLFILFTLNIFRNIALFINYHFFDTTFDFNHKYTYVLIVYLAVFAIWRFWLNRYSAIVRAK